VDAAIFTDPPSEIARSVFARHGFRQASDPAVADLLWVRTGYRSLFAQLAPDQILNHLPAEREVVDKGPLTENLKRYATSARPALPPLASFYPETYCLYDAEERERFLAALPGTEDPRDLWILKPDRGSKGEGIRLLWRLAELRSPCLAPQAGAPSDGCRFVIQRYVRNPLLIHGRKSGLRVFVLVASVEPLRVLVYRDGFVRINSVPYRLDDLSPVVHLTNTLQQRDHPSYDAGAQVWTFPQLEAYLSPQAGRSEADLLDRHLLPAVERALEFVFRAAQARLATLPAQGRCFGLYAADVLLDDELRPWLLELQVNPGLKHFDPAKRQIIPALLGETIRVVLEIRERERTGQGLERLDSLDRFRWVVREAVP
jgi:hypothetical protein